MQVLDTVNISSTDDSHAFARKIAQKYISLFGNDTITPLRSAVGFNGVLYRCQVYGRYLSCTGIDGSFDGIASNRITFRTIYADLPNINSPTVFGARIYTSNPTSLEYNGYTQSNGSAQILLL